MCEYGNVLSAEVCGVTEIFDEVWSKDEGGEN